MMRPTFCLRAQVVRGLLFAAPVVMVAGCGNSGPVDNNMPPVIGGPGNQNNPYKDINLSNESENAAKLKAIQTPGR